jgi:hypothetical protein
MFNLDVIRAARWDELYLFLTHGNPPVIVILLGLNTLFFIIYLVRRANQRHRLRQSTVYMVQGLVIFANAFILFREDAVRLVMSLKGIL